MCAIRSDFFPSCFAVLQLVRRDVFCFSQSAGSHQLGKFRAENTLNLFEEDFLQGFDVWWGQPTFAKKYPRRQDEKTVSGHCLYTSQSRIFLIPLLSDASTTPCRHDLLPFLHHHTHTDNSL